MKNAEIITGGVELLEEVQPLWEKLNDYHLSNARTFASHFQNQTFSMRKQKFIQDPNTIIHVDLARLPDNKTLIGYCISTITPDGIGEIDSLFVEPSCRSLGLGDQLMRLALNWLDGQQVRMKIIGVAEGNEGLFAFYERYGFYPKRTILEQKEG